LKYPEENKAVLKHVQDYISMDVKPGIPIITLKPKKYKDVSNDCYYK
jgi:hypothetical protein